MKQEQFNQTIVLKKHLTQKKWWNNPKLNDLWVTTHLGTKALVIYIIADYYILLDKHYNQLKVQESRVKESYTDVCKKYDMLCKFVDEIIPKVRKKKSVVPKTTRTYVESDCLINEPCITRPRPLRDMWINVDHNINNCED